MAQSEAGRHNYMKLFSKLTKLISSLFLVACPMRVAFWNFMPTFSSCIIVVVFGSSEKQMIWTNAARIVALVANMKFFVERPIHVFIRQSMSFLSAAIDFKKSVSIIVPAASINPTLCIHSHHRRTVFFINLRPKSFIHDTVIHNKSLPQAVA